MPCPALPAGFAARVALQVGDYEERAQFESSVLTVTVIVALFALLFAQGFTAMVDKFFSQHRVSQT